MVCTFSKFVNLSFTKISWFSVKMTRFINGCKNSKQTTWIIVLPLRCLFSCNTFLTIYNFWCEIFPFHFIFKNNYHFCHYLMIQFFYLYIFVKNDKIWTENFVRIEKILSNLQKNVSRTELREIFHVVTFEIESWKYTHFIARGNFSPIFQVWWNSQVDEIEKKAHDRFSKMKLRNYRRTNGSFIKTIFDLF